MASSPLTSERTNSQRLVEQWLAQTPLGRFEYRAVSDAFPRPLKRRKIKQETGPVRTPLGSIAYNIMNVDTGTPGPKKRKYNPQTPRPHIFEEDEVTPRLPTSLTFRGSSPDRDSSPRPTTKHSVSSASSGARSGRSVSPKKIPALRGLPNPIRQIQMAEAGCGTNAPLPAALAKLVEEVHNYAQGKNIVPVHYRGNPKNLESWDQPNFFEVNSQRARLGGTPPLEDIDYFYKNVLEHARLNESEAAWNYLHAVLGHMALRYSIHGDKLRFVNVTTASISPRSLLPANLNGYQIPSKKVDFTIVLRPDEEMQAAFVNIPPVDGDDSPTFNQTDYDVIIDMPIAINIETKRMGEGREGARVQLSIWVGAQFKRLRLLMHDAGHSDDEMPVLPLLIAQGATWYFLAASQDSTYRTTIWDYGCIGDCTKRPDIFRVLAVLQLLMHWAETEYRPWFRTYALGL